MKKSIFLLAIVFLFTSCQNWYISQNVNSEIKKKTSIKDFSNLNEPIVLTMSIYDSVSFMGNKDFDTKAVYDGNIIYVLDWETDSIFDWIYSPTGNCYKAGCIEIGNPVKYYATCGEYDYAWLTLGKPTLETKSSDYLLYTDTDKIKSDYLPLETIITNNDKEYYSYSFVDMNDNLKVSGPINMNVDYIGGLSAPVSDEDGNLWQVFPTDTNCPVCKIDPKKNTNEVIFNFPVEYIEYSSADGKEKDFCYPNYVIVGKFDDYLFVRKDMLGFFELKLPPCNELYIYSISNKKLLKTILVDIPTEIAGHIYTVTKVNNKYYALAAYDNKIDCSRSICLEEIDIDKGVTKILFEDPFLITQKVYVRGTRMYFFSSWTTSQVEYMYYDTESGILSDKKLITEETVLK